MGGLYRATQNDAGPQLNEGMLASVLHRIGFHAIFGAAQMPGSSGARPHK